MFALLILLPMLAALALVATGRFGMRQRYIAVAGSAASLLMMPLLELGNYTLQWLNVDTLSLDITVSLAPLNMLLLFVVLFVGTLILVYSAGFMDVRSEQRRYYSEMLAFEVAMAAFAMSGSFVLTFIAWEFLSLFSYFLIGFWHSREKAARAARFAITMILIGDVCLLASIVVFWHIFGTLDFATINIFAQYQHDSELYLGALLLLIAIFTKSAQFPFQEWLPDAMEGPTPVSAFLHSTTMVKAGVFMAIILFPLFSASGLRPLMLAIGIVTAVLATLNATVERHIKKVIAYSTIQELSLMLVAVGSGAVIAAIYFFVIQSFYKALLFFTSGAVMKSTGREDLEEVGGLGNNRLLFVSTAVGVLSLAGFLPLSGGFSAAGIDSGVASNMAVYAIISAVSFLTSFFIFRWFTMISKPRVDLGTVLRYRSESRQMTYTTAVLAVMTVASSALFFYMVPLLALGGSQAYLSKSLVPSASVPDAMLSTVLIAAGALLGYVMYRPGRTRVARKSHGILDLVVYNRRVVVFAYRLFALFIYEIAEGIALFDAYLSEFVDEIGHYSVVASRYVRRASVGRVNPYVIVFAAGVALLAVYMYMVV
jgi:NADH-quinone oxidoreductase subunit L